MHGGARELHLHPDRHLDIFIHRLFTLMLSFTLTGTIESGLPTLQLPQFGISSGGNQTEAVGGEDQAASLGTMIRRFCVLSRRSPPPASSLAALKFYFRLGLSLIIVPVVAIIDAAAIAKAFGEIVVDDDEEWVGF